MSRNDKSVDNQSFRLCFNADNYIRFRDSIGFIESRKIKDTKPCFSHQYHHRRVGNSFYVKVKQIEHSHNDVYDFKVPESHSFISNGMISHNTGRMSSAEPNLQNIPSHAIDIRHMFRATPSSETNVDCDCDESLNTIAVSLHKWEYVNTPDGYVTVSDLNVGDSVKLIAGKEEVYKNVKSMEDSSEDPGICNVVF